MSLQRMPLSSRLGQLKTQINDGADSLEGGKAARLSNATISRTLHNLDSQLNEY